MLFRSFINDSQLQEIEQLLTGMSVQLPSIQTPLAQRGLVSSNHQVKATSLAELLDRMSIAFAIARDTFVAVETAWKELESQLITTHQSLAQLQQLAKKLNIATPPALITAQTKFNELQLEIDLDPLGINRAFMQEIAPLINNSRHELETLDLQRQQLQADFATAPQLLQQLTQLNRDAIAAHTESQAKIQHDLPIISPLPIAEIVELERWLARLVAKCADGIIAPVRVGLTNWLDKVQAYTIAAASALTANRLPLDRRQELRGRLDALSAKALAKGKAEDPVLTDLATQARQALYSSPTDLNLAIELVRKYEQSLNQRLAC